MWLKCSKQTGITSHVICGSTVNKTITHLEEEEIGHVLGLPDQASILLGVEAPFNDS